MHLEWSKIVPPTLLPNISKENSTKCGELQLTVAKSGLTAKFGTHLSAPPNYLLIKCYGWVVATCTPPNR